jgi:hypothetical protein
MEMNLPRLRVVVYKADGWWIIHGLDQEFVTLARHLEDVPGEIQRFLSVLFASCQQLGVEPFHGYAPAPQKYWRMYEHAEPWTEPLLPIGLPGDLGSGPAIDTRLAA